MTSVTGDTVEAASRRIRRFSVLPAILGLVAIVVLLVAARMVLDDEPPWPATAVLLAAIAVGATVATGFPVGLYVGLAVYAVAMVGGDVADRALTLTVATGSMVVAHELVRASLDARRPARFGPRVWFRSAARTVVLVAAVAAVSAFARWIDDASPSAWLVPLGITAAALPLVAHRIVDGLPKVVAAGLALVIAGAAVFGAVAGATARSQIERASTPIAEPPPGLLSDDDDTTATTLSAAAESLAADGAGLQQLIASVLFAITVLIVGAIILALRREEMVFEIGEVDLDLDDATLGFAGSGEADVDDDLVAIDDETIGQLLADLALDITSERDAGRAVRYAYANVERRLAELGVVPVDSETEQEFLVRAIPALGEDGRAMADLTRLFERARFGHVPISEAMRTEALIAVDRLRVATTPPRGDDQGDDR